LLQLTATMAVAPIRTAETIYKNLFFMIKMILMNLRFKFFTKVHLFLKQQKKIKK